MPDRHTSALLVVDMQNDFLATGGYYDEKTKRERANQGKLHRQDIDELARLYLRPPPTCEIRQPYQDVVDAVVEIAAAALAQNVLTVFVQAAYDPASVYRPPLFLAAPTRRDYACHPDSWGADFVEPIQALVALPQAKVVVKHTFDAFFETELRGLLHFHQIETIYVAGVETNVCVLCTALSALTNGFQTVILEDCVATSQEELHAPALKILEVAKSRRMSKQQVMEMLRQHHLT